MRDYSSTRRRVETVVQSKINPADFTSPWMTCTCVPIAVLSDPSLTAGAKLLLGLLCQYNDYDDRRILLEYPEVLNDMLGASPSQVLRWFKELTKGRWIQRLSLDEPPEKTPAPPPAAPKDRRGFVYVLESSGLYKIGRTKDLERRFHEHRKTLPSKFDVMLSGFVTDATRVEKTLHATFEAKRIQVEWFRLDDADLEEIREVLRVEAA